MGYQCFSQRLLNPFRGITNTIRYESAEAVTADGVRWDIYVSNDGLLKGLPYNRRTQVIEHNCDGAAANYLAQYVNSLTADKSAAQLFERRLDGQGTALAGIRMAPGLENRVLPETAFPSLILRSGEHDNAHSRLIGDFFRWQAPWLLLLRNLGLEMRREYEQNARTQPLKIARQYLLYPEIADRQAIDAARVEARLRKARPDKPAGDVPLSAFYIELSPEVVD